MRNRIKLAAGIAKRAKKLIDKAGGTENIKDNIKAAAIAAARLSKKKYAEARDAIQEEADKLHSEQQQNDDEKKKDPKS